MEVSSNKGDQALGQNKYKSRCPGNLSLVQNATYTDVPSIHTQASPATQDAASVLFMMNYRVMDDGFYLPTPSTPEAARSFTFNHHQGKQQKCHLPVNSPLTPSCAYYNTPKPKFTYPDELLPPTSLFTKSIAGSMMAEEMGDDSRTKPRAYDIASILSLPQDNWETESYDFFEHVCDTSDFKSCYSPSTPYPSRPADDVQPMQQSIKIESSENRLGLFTKPNDTIIKKESKPKSKPKSAAKESDSKKEKVLQKIDENKPLKCDICPKRFSHKSSLTVHLRSHTGVRPYMCQVCDRRFADNSTYVKHLRTHTKEKPYSCSICGRAFSQSGNLKRHQKIHK